MVNLISSCKKNTLFIFPTKFISKKTSKNNFLNKISLLILQLKK